MKKYNIAIAGVTGIVGTTFLEVLSEKKYLLKIYTFLLLKNQQVKK